jgi:hypothetical protein
LIIGNNRIFSLDQVENELNYPHEIIALMATVR